MKRVLVSGAGGRLGRQLIPLLLERGYCVRAVLHRNPLTASWAGEVEAVNAELENGDGLNRAVRDVDVIYHLAALMPPVSDDEIFRTNVAGTYRLLQAAAMMPVKPRFIFASTDAAYCTGWSYDRYHAPIDENTPLRPVLFYGSSKVLGEQMCMHFQEIHRIPVVRLRFDWILEASEVLHIFTGAPYKDLLVDEDRGKWDASDTVKIPLEQSGGPFREHICDVRDSAQGALLALEREEAKGQVFNIAGPAPFTYTEVGPKLAERLGVMAVPGRCRGLYSYEISNQKAKGVLGYQPRYSVLESLEDALSRRAAALPAGSR